MAIKEISTGIFTHEEIGNLTRAERKLLRERALSFQDLESRLESLKTAARETLEAAGVRSVPGGSESKLGEDEWRANPQLGDAVEILNYVGILRDAMRAGATDQYHVTDKALCCAFHLGQISVRFLVRPHEKPAAIGRKVREGGAKGRRVTDGRYDRIHHQHERWRNEARGMKGSVRQKALKIARKERINFHTVRKALYKK